MPINVIVPSNKSLADYAELRRRVREAIAAGKERALAAVERESVRTKWEVGKLIEEHVLLNKARAEYGKQVIERLSRDISISKTELYYMLEFAKSNPIFRPAGKLSWGHHEVLLGINDDKKRQRLTREAARKKWTREALRSEVNRRKAAKEISVSKAPAEEPLVPVKGTSGIYRIVTAKAGPWAGQTALDLGFANYHRPIASRLPFRDREIVSASPAGKLTRAKDATEGDLFTYRAYLLQVTDGDTLWVLVDLGFGFITQQQLRLRGIDAPEITSRAGGLAKRFVERELKNISSFVIASTKSDKYDRYLADVFYTVGGTERFLNNRLLEAGHALLSQR